MQCAAELDETPRAQLAYGQGLRRLLRQPQYHPMSRSQQVITLVAAMHHIMQNIPRDEIGAFRDEMLAWFEHSAAELCASIEGTGLLSDGDKGKLESLAEQFLGVWSSRREGA